MTTFQLNAEVNGDVVQCIGSVWRQLLVGGGGGGGLRNRVSLSLLAPRPFLGFSPQLKVILSTESRTFERIHSFTLSPQAPSQASRP
ncbi:hypothetical protein GQ55_3G453200 [Panicum hallii var. hallii]|uniref:Uncharacterized protein n=1 Tax=Panicum hallii var. hallii TaxID=1504633 RepID=A0A2T7EIK3_9POAL|nr:hypothetical protein GQ55_3G453200 [Panicum hallii var. hallii]